MYLITTILSIVISNIKETSLKRSYRVSTLDTNKINHHVSRLLTRRNEDRTGWIKINIINVLKIVPCRPKRGYWSSHKTIKKWVNFHVKIFLERYESRITCKSLYFECKLVTSITQSRDTW